jgi:hypothetical protein
MTDHFLSKFILDQRNRIHPDQRGTKAGALRDPYLNDPEYIELYQRYISSMQAFTKAALEAIAIANKSSLPGPRRQPDFYKLDQLRRFFETDAYKYFTYHPNIKGPLPPQTRMRSGRGHLKDATTAQLLSNETKALVDCNRAAEEAITMCREVWERYKESPEPKSDEIKRTLLDAVALVQVFGDEKTSELGEEINQEVNTIAVSIKKE